jgi:hypothetical protein
MRVHKHILLSYGFEKGYYTEGEFDWCISGNKIKDYEKSFDSKNIPQKKNLASKF